MNTIKILNKDKICNKYQIKIKKIIQECQKTINY